VRRLVVAAAAVLLVAAPALAADEDAIDPDRPDLTNGAKTVGRGRVQVEGGVVYQRTGLAGLPSQRAFAVETTLRAGVTERLELRVDGVPFVRLRGAEEDTDVGDFTLGAKYRFLDAPDEAWWPTLALGPFVKLPTAGQPIGSGRTDFGLILIASFDLPWRLGLDVNAGMAAVGQNGSGGYLLQARASASLAYAVSEPLSVFAEVFYASRAEREGRDQAGVDAGVIWRVTRDVALDVAAGTSLAGQAPDFFVRSGASVRFGR
jgi:hypothetical protein